MRVLTHPYPYTYSVVGCIYAHAHHTQHRDSTHHTPPYTPLCATYRHVPCVGRVVIPGKRMRPLEGHTEASMGKCLHMGGLQRSTCVTAVTNMGQDAWAGASVLHVRQAGPTTTELHQSGKRRTQWALRGPHAGTLPMVEHATLEAPLTDVLGLHHNYIQPPVHNPSPFVRRRIGSHRQGTYPAELCRVSGDWAFRHLRRRLGPVEFR